MSGFSGVSLWTLATGFSGVSLWTLVTGFSGYYFQQKYLRGVFLS